MKALVGAFNQEQALVGAFSVIVKTDCGTDVSFYSTRDNQMVESEEPLFQDRTQSQHAAAAPVYVYNCCFLPKPFHYIPVSVPAG